MFLACALCGCGGGKPAGEGPSSGARSRVRNVVLISIDTLRADHLGSYGYPLATSPRLDAFAARAVRFENCLSASGHTLSSHKALLSGRHVASFLAAYSKAGGPPRALPLPLAYYQLALTSWPSPPLARRLKDAGMDTLGFTDGGYMKARYGLESGFDEYRSERLGLGGQSRRAQEWLAAHPGRPFFLFLHCYDAHCPYDPPPEHLKMFEDRCEGRLRFVGTCGKDYFNALTLTADERLHIRRHYDAGIHHADEELGKLLDFLEASGRFADTVIVVTSDHGESLGERDFVGHGQLYDNQLHVPLVVYAPGATPSVVKAPVAGVDVAPTILDLLSGAVPEGLDGWSLKDFLGLARAQVSPPHPPAEFEARLRLAAVTVNEGKGDITRLRKFAAQDARGVKLIWDVESGARELYLLGRDPDEKTSLAGAGVPADAAPSESALARFIGAHDPGRLRGLDASAAGKGRDDLSPEELQELRALGYVN